MVRLRLTDERLAINGFRPILQRHLRASRDADHDAPTKIVEGIWAPLYKTWNPALRLITRTCALPRDFQTPRYDSQARWR